MLWDILCFCEVYRANGGDSEYRVGINEGKRRVGLFIEHLLSVVDTQKVVDWKHDMKRQEAKEEEMFKADAREGRR